MVLHVCVVRVLRVLRCRVFRVSRVSQADPRVLGCVMVACCG